MSDSHRGLFVVCGLVFVLALAVPTVGPYVLGVLVEPFAAETVRGVSVSPVANETDVRGEVVDYGGLTAGERRLFDEARVEGTASIGDGDSDSLRRYGAVRYGGRLYAVYEVAS